MFLLCHAAAHAACANISAVWCRRGIHTTGWDENQMSGGEGEELDLQHGSSSVVWQWRLATRLPRSTTWTNTTNCRTIITEYFGLVTRRSKSSFALKHSVLRFFYLAVWYESYCTVTKLWGEGGWGERRAAGALTNKSCITSTWQHVSADKVQCAPHPESVWHLLYYGCQAITKNWLHLSI